MSILKKIYFKWRAFKMRSRAKSEAHMNEIDCLINGHQWSSEFNPKTELNKRFKDRVYCKHCGVRYHQHTYKEVD